MTDETRLAVAALEDKTVNELRSLYEEVFDEVCRSRHKKYLVRRDQSGSLSYAITILFR